MAMNRNVLLFISIIALFISCTQSPTQPPPKNLSVSSSLSGDSYSSNANWSISIVFQNTGNVDLKITAASIFAYGSLALPINDFNITFSDVIYGVNIPAGTTKYYSVSGTSTTYLIYSFAISYSVTSSDGSLSKDFSFPKASLTIH
jgi:heme/copper-type cytochrome/quinol oxidase subunit 2